MNLLRYEISDFGIRILILSKTELMQILCFILSNVEASDELKIKSRFLVQLYFLKEVVCQSCFIKSNATVATTEVCYLWDC